MSVDSQRILTVPKHEFLRRFSPKPFEDEAPKTLDMLAAIHRLGRFVARSDAEADVGLLQIIAYGSVRSNGKVFLLRRRSSDRPDISDRFALALGGHVDAEDSARFGGPILGALCRELGEELEPTDVISVRHRGFVYDRSNTSSSIHLCAYYEVEVLSEDVAPRGATDADEFRVRRGRSRSGTFVAPDDLDGIYSRLDPWSRILAQYYFKRSIREAADTFHQTTLPYVDEAA
jgi:predicted NUDIX family phosphoesterase